jgi:2',3'-cyclic-nucleotide 2'-phosphodiesterase (5'-nucleotidase family)
MQAQKDFTFTYSKIVLDSVYRQNPKNPLIKMLAPYKRLNDKKMNVVIGNAAQTMPIKRPQSLLSNFCTDVILQFVNQSQELPHADLSLLNVGGIRTPLPQGDITVGKMYEILPFENKLVIITLKGDELQRMFDNFTDTTNQPCANVQIAYRDHKPIKVLVGSQPIEPDSLYNIATVDFIRNGGDSILPDDVYQIKKEQVKYTDIVMRNIVLNHIKSLTEKGLSVSAELDNRVVVE